MSDQPLGRPTRIITCAWGDRYVGELLSITLPALLAPGNLPYVASIAPCELVILTQQASFGRVMGDVTVRRIRELCGVRLIEIDDLISSPDQYGMVITYALHRGFSDLGEAATDTWLLFLNADFILADGGLRSVVRQLARGERLVAAPSYCVKAEDAARELVQRVEPRTRTLAIPPREMAALVLRHRHDTIRGKTVNQAVISIRYMDQFYWLVDANTLLGHQMPVAIVGMRPERNLPEPNSFWDYGLIREFCPTAEHFVLGDSDDFLMMELRRDHPAEGWVMSGWPEPAEIARNMLSFATPYTKDMARHPLTLHAADLPTGLDDARARLRAFVDTVFAHLPGVLPSHLEHPQFDYHWSTFMEARHRYLSTRLGSATEAEEPPSSLSELDRVWWKLDGLAKAHRRRLAELTDLMARRRTVIDALQSRLQDRVRTRGTEADERLMRELDGMEPPAQKRSAELYRSVHLPPNETAPPDGGPPATDDTSWIEPMLDDVEEWSRFATEVAEKKEFFARTLNSIEKFYRVRLQTLEADFETAREPLQLDYERLLRRRIPSASIPHAVGDGSRAPAAEPGGHALLATARRVYHRWYGTLPRVRRAHPYWGAMRHLVRLVDTAAANGAANTLVVMGRGGVADTVADHVPGVHAQVSLSELLEGNVRKAFSQPITFDLCICSLGPSELTRFRDVRQAVMPYMNRGGKILAFYPNFSLRPLSTDEITMLWTIPDLRSGRVYFAGSDRSARVVRRFHATLSRGSGGRVAKLVSIATMLARITPSALAASRSDAAAPEELSSRVPQQCLSVTIEVSA